MRKSVKNMKNSILSIAVTLASIPSAIAADQHQTEKLNIKVEKVVGGIDSGWAMAMLPNGHLLVTEKEGRLLLIDPDNPDERQKVKGLPPLVAIGQGGLLDVVLDPEFETNRTIYMTFAHLVENRTGTAIASAKLLSDDTSTLQDVKILYSMEAKNGSGVHFGSRIVPDGKGHLFFTIGDRGTPDRSQDAKDGAGSVHRIKTDGTIPKDNPYITGKNWLPSIWSIGHRNPQGATLNDTTGALWTLAHGAKGGDEINIPQAGKNYGWPVISYGTHYSGKKIGVGTHTNGMEQPIYYWDPSIAPSGMDFYSSDMLGAWKDNLFVGALKFETLIRLEIKDNKVVSEERLFEEEYGRVRDVRAFSDGALWFLTDDSEGGIYRITPAN